MTDARKVLSDVLYIHRLSIDHLQQVAAKLEQCDPSPQLRRALEDALHALMGLQQSLHDERESCMLPES
ncbi:MAG: hypothetical protein EOP64_00205 [Sphingomonas sp.]|nr:MAG: hypothetical protein EOP64_00205 [Sphingomonas sp.]